MDITKGFFLQIEGETRSFDESYINSEERFQKVLKMPLWAETDCEDSLFNRCMQTIHLKLGHIYDIIIRYDDFEGESSFFPTVPVILLRKK